MSDVANMHRDLTWLFDTAALLAITGVVVRDPLTAGKTVSMTINTIALDPTNLQPAVQAAVQFFLWSTCIVAGPILFYRGLRAFQLRRYVKNVPRSTVRSAAMGPVEVCGRAAGPYTLSASFCPGEFLCCWYVSEVNTVQTACAPLFLDDGTGVLMVCPSALEALKGVVIPTLLGPGVVYVIRPEDTMFILGNLEENPWSHPRHPSEQDDDENELARIGPGFVSREEAAIMRQSPDPYGVSSAPAMVATASNSSREFDLYPPKILMKGKGPYLVSSLSPRDKLARLTWTSVCYVLGGPVLTLLGLGELLVHGPTLIRMFLN